MTKKKETSKGGGGNKVEKPNPERSGRRTAAKTLSVKMKAQQQAKKKPIIQNGSSSKASINNRLKIVPQSSSSSAKGTKTLAIKKPPLIKQPIIAKPKPKEKQRLSPVKKIQQKVVARSSTPKGSPQQSTSKAASNKDSTPLSSQPPTRKCAEQNKSKVTIGAKIPIDRSQVNIRHDIRINGVLDLMNTAQKATPKVKQFLLNECDIIMECRWCRNFFRSVPNFVHHKQNYCKSLFHPASDNGCSQFLQRAINRPDSIEYNYFSLPTSSTSPSKEESQVSSSLLNSGVVNGGLNDNNDCEENSGTKSSHTLYSDIQDLTDPDQLPPKTDQQQVNLLLEPVGNRKETVVYQKRLEESMDPSTSSNLKDNFHDSREVVDRDTAILGPDGKVICTGTARGIEKIVRHLTAQIDLSHRKMVQNSTNQFPDKCDICKTVFNSEKALRQHRRDAPDCLRHSVYNKLPNGNDRGTHQSSGIKRSSNSQQLNHTASKNSMVKNENNDEKNADRQQNTEKLTIRQLFSSKSPLKKTPVKLSPYKKTIGKAVKQLQHGSSGGALLSGRLSLSEHKSSPEGEDSPFVCIKCSSTFHTTGEMSLHLATMCDHVKRLPPKRPSSGSLEKIGIEVRKMYKLAEPEEENGTSGNDSVVDIPIVVEVDKKTYKPTKEEAAEEAFKNSNKPTEESIEADVQKGEIPTASSSTSEQPFVVAVSDHDYLIARDIKAHSAITNDEVTSSETNNNEKPHKKSERAYNLNSNCPRLNNNNNTMSEGIEEVDKLFVPYEIVCSDNERDRETSGSDNTDSGVSLDAVTIEELGIIGDNNEVLSLAGKVRNGEEVSSSNDDSRIAQFSRILQKGSRPKRNPKPDDRVLTPKNKNLKQAIDVQRRSSFRSRKPTPAAVAVTVEKQQTASKRK